MPSEKNYTNPEFTEAFQRVKKILIDLKNRIMPVKQGNAVNFRQNINDAIGTIPETDQETGVITKDGYGMSGAVFAMGEAVEKGLDNMDTALVQFTNDANTALTNFGNEKDTALNDFKDEKNTALTNFTDEQGQAFLNFEKRKNIALDSFKAEKTKVLNDFKDEKNTILTNFGNESKEALDNLQVNFDAEVKEAMEQATENAQTAADNAIKATDAISNKFNKFLVVSQASVNNKPVDSSGNEIEQMPGGIWFRITSSTNNGENNTENGGIESTT